MTETIDDQTTGFITLTGDEEPEKKTPWLLYLIIAGIAVAALLG